MNIFLDMIRAHCAVMTAAFEAMSPAPSASEFLPVGTRVRHSGLDYTVVDWDGNNPASCGYWIAPVGSRSTKDEVLAGRMGLSVVQRPTLYVKGREPRKTGGIL